MTDRVRYTLNWFVIVTAKVKFRKRLCHHNLSQLVELFFHTKR